VLPIARELESAGADSIAGPDLGSLAPQDLTVRAARGLLVLCAVALPDTLVVETAGAALWIPRAPAPGRDSLLLYLPGDSTAAVDAWLPLPLAAGPFAGSCPGGAPAWRLVSRLDTATARIRGVPSDGVVRIFESLAFRLYGSAATWHVGQVGLSAGATVQPLAGPLLPQGIVFDGLSSALLAAGAPAAVATIRIRAAGAGDAQSALGPGQAPPARDSLALLAPLRNTP
jgi:hypothetical protein